MHDSLGHEVSDGLVDDTNVGVHQVTNGLYLPLQLRVHREAVYWRGIFRLHLNARTHTSALLFHVYNINCNINFAFALY